MKILITGGTGFIGRSLSPALLADGHSMTIFSRYPNKVESVFGPENTIDQFDSALSRSRSF